MYANKSIMERNNMNNLLISYPRSGYHWAWARLAAILEYEFGVEEAHSFIKANSLLRGEEQNNTILETDIVPLVTSHLTYDRFTGKTWSVFQPGCPVYKHSKLDVFPETNKIFVLLRKAEASIISMYHRLPNTEPTFQELADAIISPDSFVNSIWGTKRFVCFLNDIQRIFVETGRNPTFLFYEDMFKKDSVNQLPALLGIPEYQLKDPEKIFKSTSKTTLKKRAKEGDLHISLARDGLLASSYLRNGLKSGWKKELQLTTIKKSEELLVKECLLKPYLEKYHQ